MHPPSAHTATIAIFIPIMSPNIGVIAIKLQRAIARDTFARGCDSSLVSS